MLTFISGLFGGFVCFVKELTKTLIIDTIVGFILKPVGLV